MFLSLVAVIQVMIVSVRLFVWVQQVLNNLRSLQNRQKRLPTNPWPQYPMIKRVGYGQEEANFVQDTELTTYATSTTEFIGADSGQVIAAKTIKVGPGFKPIEGTEEIIKADLVFTSNGIHRC